MPPYSKLAAFMVEKYREIAEDPKASVDQKLRALGHLEGLQVKKRKPKGGKTSSSFKKGDPRIKDNRKAPKAIDSKLLGAAPAIDSSLSDAALLGTVESVEPLAEPLQPAGPPGSS